MNQVVPPQSGQDSMVAFRADRVSVQPASQHRPAPSSARRSLAA